MQARLTGQLRLKMAAAAAMSRSPCASSSPEYQPRKKRPYSVSQLPPQLRKNGASCSQELIEHVGGCTFELVKRTSVTSQPDVFLLSSKKQAQKATWTCPCWSWPRLSHRH